MKHTISCWYSVLVLLAGAMPLQAGELKNADFENEAAWQFVNQGDGLSSGFDQTISQSGRRSFLVSLPTATKTAKEDFAGLTQTVELTASDKGISFYVKDDYTGKTERYHWMELLLDGEVIWEADVAGGNLEWRKVSVDLARYLNPHSPDRN